MVLHFKIVKISIYTDMNLNLNLSRLVFKMVVKIEQDIDKNMKNIGY